MRAFDCPVMPTQLTVCLLDESLVERCVDAVCSMWITSNPRFQMSNSGLQLTEQDFQPIAYDQTICALHHGFGVLVVEKYPPRRVVALYLACDYSVKEGDENSLTYVNPSHLTRKCRLWKAEMDAFYQPLVKKARELVNRDKYKTLYSLKGGVRKEYREKKLLPLVLVVGDVLSPYFGYSYVMGIATHASTSGFLVERMGSLTEEQKREADIIYEIFSYSDFKSSFFSGPIDGLNLVLAGCNLELRGDLLVQSWRRLGLPPLRHVVFARARL